MKKLLFSLLLLLCCMTAVVAQPRPDGFIEVSTAQQLKEQIQRNNGAKIRLACDIDISDMGTICDKFTGTISGKHQVYNEKLDTIVNASYVLKGSGYVEDLARNDGKDAYLFESVEGATFEYLIFQDISLKNTEWDNVGVIARTATNTTFYAVSMDHVGVFQDEDNAGTFVGTATGCHFTGAFINYCEVITNGFNAGGLVGESNGSEYTGCTVYANCGVYADGTVFYYMDCNAGGVVGKSANDHFTRCTNQALVGGLCDGLGGITGYSNGSTFLKCKNYGNVLHCEYKGDENKMYFRSTIDDIRERMKNITQAQIKEIMDAIEAGCYSSLEAIVALTVADQLVALGTGTHLGEMLVDMVLDNAIALGENYAGSTALEVLSFYFTVVVIAAAITGAIIYDMLTDYDRIGGICGEAQNGTFELCSNYADIKNDDEGGGGIVGDGYNLVINNCYNSGYVYNEGSPFNGSIIGLINHCKVNNCVSAVAQPIIGASYNSLHNVDPTSGNNYRLAGGKDSKEPEWEMAVSKEILASGRVQRWLNNGYENRIQGIKPWYQNVRVDDAKDKDAAPVLDATHNQDERLTRDVISNADQLVAFAQKVNAGNQFANAVLVNDIDMSGVSDWTPIGLNVENKQYRGVFEGNGYTIHNLTCSSDKEVGLFGTVHTGAEIRNVIIGDDCEFTSTGNEGVAGIVGKVDIDWKWGNVVIEGCANLGTITAQNTANAGGILGLVKNTTDDNVHVYVSNCYNMGTITAGNSNSALLCGYMRNSGVVTNCWSGGQLLSSTEGVPYDDTQDRSEYFVGYWEKLDIRNCVSFADLPADLSQNGVERVSAAAVSSGELTYKLNGNTNSQTATLGWQQNLGTDLQPVLGNKGIYQHRQLGTEFSSICVPFTVSSDDTVQYYRFCGGELGEYAIYIKVEAVDSLRAGTPGFYRVLGSEAEYDFRGGYDFQAVAQDYQLSTDGVNWGLMGDMTAGIHPDYRPALLDLDGRELQNPDALEPYHAYVFAPSTIAQLKDESPSGDIRFFVVSDASIYDVNLDGEVNVGDAITYINVSNKLTNFTPYCVGNRDDNRMLLSEKIVKGIR